MLPKIKSLEEYSKTFNIVKVNTAFYEIPGSELIKSKRSRIPHNINSLFVAIKSTAFLKQKF